MGEKYDNSKDVNVLNNVNIIIQIGKEDDSIDKDVKKMGITAITGLIGELVVQLLKIL